MFERRAELSPDYKLQPFQDMRIFVPVPKNWVYDKRPDRWGNPVHYVTPQPFGDPGDLTTYLVAFRYRSRGEPWMSVEDARQSVSYNIGRLEPVTDPEVTKEGSMMIFRRQFKGADPYYRAGNLPFRYWIQLAANYHTGIINKLLFKTPEVYAAEDASIAKVIIGV